METSLPIGEAAPSLQARTVAASAVTPAERDACWAIFEQYYEDVERSTFDGDFLAKDHVILLVDGPRIHGFCTLARDYVELDGRVVVSVFTGDTIIDAHKRGTTALQWEFFKYLAATKAMNPHRRVVWFLISKGYKTYLTLSRNLPDYYPRAGADTPDWALRLIRELSRRRFGRAVSEGRYPVLPYEDGHGRLRPGVAPVAGEDHPHIRFFVEANPGHADGDELCCVGLVNARLIGFYPLKLLRSLPRKRARTTFQ